MQRNRKGTTPIYIAGQEGHTEMVELLLRSGADVNYAIPDGCTGLTQAAKNGHLATVHAFIAAAPANAHKTLALQFANRQGHGEVARVLLHAIT